MTKVLVANENKRQNIAYCQYLTNDTKLTVMATNSGLDTLNKYLEINPNILILDSYFKDITSVEIIDRLSILKDEKQKCNIILTANSKKEQLAFLDVAKIYKILQKPFDYQHLLDTVIQLDNENKYEKLDEMNLHLLFLNLDLNVTSEGVIFLKDAIKECYYFPNLLGHLDKVLNLVAYKHHIKPETVRSAIRTTLKPLNLYDYTHSPNSLVSSLFDTTRNISPKYFLDVVVPYLRIKNQKNKK